MRFDQQQVNVAHRHENLRLAKASGRNLRSAVEATVRSIKHPFRNGKLPVCGKPRVSMMLVASAAMVNVRRIWRYRTEKNEAETAQVRANSLCQQGISFVFRVVGRLFSRSFADQSLRSAWAA